MHVSKWSARPTHLPPLFGGLGDLALAADTIRFRPSTQGLDGVLVLTAAAATPVATFNQRVEQ